MLLCWPLQEEMLECFPLLCGGSLVALGHGQGGQRVEPNMKGGTTPTWTAHLDRPPWPALESAQSGGASTKALGTSV